ncbi:unnamed protein product [Darwinula stevensoni]|uniref:CUE domain-containing protein n=1 Tax=Darwinula stevensoni TaxID=69355 RepID=A0A7R9FRM2_9CRUS|nr:unnamed protein product [Darwinula stevensoni]CAG0901284.1 unnamed protein product [Darwinula stevensoni]
MREPDEDTEPTEEPSPSTSSTVPPLSDLFNQCRWSLSAESIIFVILYFPIGVVLSVIRIFICFHVYIAACLLPRNSLVRTVVLRWMWSVLGLVIRKDDSLVKGSHSHDPPRLYVANNISSLDPLVTHLAIDASSVERGLFPTWFLYAYGYGYDHKTFEDSTASIALYPEGIPTNGKVGLLQFVQRGPTKEWLLSEASKQGIQPLALSVERLLPLSVSVVGSAWWIDLYWLFFSPVTIFHIKVLPVIWRNPGQGKAEEGLLEHTRTTIAKALNLQLTPHTHHDYVEWMKRRTVGEYQSVVNSLPPELSLAVMRIKEILPSVPLAVIVNDIRRTGSADETISHLVDGTIPYTPENMTSKHPSPAVSQLSSTSSSTSMGERSGVRESFGRTPKIRMQSFEERKRELLECARRKYIQKHGLKFPPLQLESE